MNATPPASNKKTATPIAELTRAATNATLTPAELETVKSLLDRRVAEHHANPASAIPWQQVRAKLFADRS